MPVILGVDPSLAHSGFSVFRTETMELLWQGAANNPSGCSTMGIPPYIKIRDAVKAVIHTHKVEHVFIERMFQSKNPAITEVLYIAAFMVRLACYEMEIPVTMVEIMGKSGWKNFILGSEYTKYKGNLSKVATRRATETALGVKMLSEHTADSAAIALAGWYLQSGIDYRTVLGLPIPEGVGIAAAKKRSVGGRRPRASKPKQPAKKPKRNSK